MSSHYFGLIAENETDCNTIREIIRRVLNHPRVRTEIRASNGCNKLRKKLVANLNDLSSKGCNVFIIVHDLDRDRQNGCLNDETKLRSILEALTSKVSNKHICIPIEEIEAWFWADPEIIKSIGRSTGKAHPNPHLIKSPKEELERLSKSNNSKPRYSNNMNTELAKKLNLELCSKRCPSFKNLIEFLRSL
jgi:hypothetical protein